jgi:HlyD family secretion protein
MTMRTRITRKRAIWGVIALALVGFLAATLRPDPVDVETMAVAASDLDVTVAEDGRVRMVDRYVVTAPVAGRLERIALREGTQVSAGQLVARIQPLPLDEPMRAQLQARLEATRAHLRAAQSTVTQARPAYEQASRELQRRQALAAQGAVAEESVEQFTLAVRAREAELNAAESSASAAAAEVAAAEAALMGAAPSRSTAAVPVRAPADGEVLRIPERSGRIIAAGEVILELGSDSALEVVVDVLSADAVRVRPGMPVTLTGWGGPALRARVRTIEPAAFTRLSALGVEEQRVNVIIDIDECPPELGDGYRIEAAIHVWSATGVLTVPNSALFRSGEDWNVFTIERNRARLRTVQIGERGVLRAQVVGGLEAGQTVVLFPSDQLVDGARVRPRRVTMPS